MRKKFPTLTCTLTLQFQNLFLKNWPLVFNEGNVIDAKSYLEDIRQKVVGSNPGKGFFSISIGEYFNALEVQREPLMPFYSMPRS